MKYLYIAFVCFWGIMAGIGAVHTFGKDSGFILFVASLFAIGFYTTELAPTKPPTSTPSGDVPQESSSFPAPSRQTDQNSE